MKLMTRHLSEKKSLVIIVSSLLIMTAFIPLVFNQVAEAIDFTSWRSWVDIEIPYFGADNILVRVTAVTIGNHLNDSMWIDEITSGDFAFQVTVGRFVAEAEYSVDSNTTTFIYIVSSREYKIARTGEFPHDYWRIGITFRTNFEGPFDPRMKYFSIPSPYYYGNCTTTYGYEQQGYYYYSLDLEIQHPSEFANFVYWVFCPPIILLASLFLIIILVTAFLAIKSKNVRQIESTLIAIGSAVIVFIPVFQLSTQELKTPFTITWIDYCFLGLLISYISVLAIALIGKTLKASNVSEKPLENEKNARVKSNSYKNVVMPNKSKLGDKIAESAEVLLWQYRECWSDVRQYDNLIWQIPSITTIIVSAIVALSSTAIMSLRTILFVVALSLNIVMTIALYKHQFFRVHRFREIEKIEDAFRNLGLPLIADGARSSEKITEQTKEGILKRMPQGWLYRRTAYKWIRTYMHLLTIALVLGLISVTFLK